VLCASPRLLLAALAPSGDELGRIGERLAERALAREGWRTLARRLLTPAGELDLFCLDPAGEPVAVEVKTGWVSALEPLVDPLLRPARRLSRRGLERRRRAARFAAAHLCGPGRGGRVDLIEVLVARPARVRLLLHRDMQEPPLGLAGHREEPWRGSGPSTPARGSP
jgi:Holliday junction resolvase-like predicted endonuclease